MSSWTDFNDAVMDTAPEKHNPDEVKTRILAQLPEYLADLYPSGQVKGKKFLIGNVTGDKGKSLQVELEGERAGLWHDFATGEGGDIVRLVALNKLLEDKRDYPQIINLMADWCRLPAALFPVKNTRQKPAGKDDLGPPTGKWDYHDPDGNLIACVYRYDTPKGKQFRPWDVTTRRHRAPDPRPLYNQPGIKAKDDVVLVEGEKSAQALIDQGICATTAMNGANAPVDKTNWNPLKGKRVLIWPDNDEPGNKYAKQAALAISEAGATSVSILKPPRSKPAKWDAADAVTEQFDIRNFLEKAERNESKPSGLQIKDWNALRYQGPAPEQKFLVEDTFPLGVLVVLAAMGDTGKGLLTLKLALEVACNKGQASEVFGERVQAHGTAVIFTAEDDLAEVHRRLNLLDPGNKRKEKSDKLLIIPLPNAGGPFPIVRHGNSGPETTPEFLKIAEQLQAIDDLALVVFDPLASFVHADINADPAVGSYLTGLLAGLSSQTGATVMVVHHMRKPSGHRGIETAEQAREAIRGTSAIVDGARVTYALWHAPYEKVQQACTSLNLVPHPNSFYLGAVVKANCRADRSIKLFKRNESGLLEDLGQRMNGAQTPEYKLTAQLTDAIRQAAHRGYPFTHTGANGIFKQRHRLPDALRHLSRKKLESMVQDMLGENPPRVVKGVATGSREHKWLDASGGPFARGEGVFLPRAPMTLFCRHKPRKNASRFLRSRAFPREAGTEATLGNH